MLSLRNRFGIPGAISVIALVFAMFGGAYAASNGGKVTASKAKAGPRGPRGKTGPAGPAGPVGPQGPAGANGKDGSNGTSGKDGAPGAAGKNGVDGTDGADGNSVATFPIASGPTDTQCEEQGGTEFEVEGGGNPPEVLCNGKEGSPWTDGGTLPAGATETGTYSFNPTAADPEFYVPISFPIRLASPLEASHVHFGFPSDPTFHAVCQGTVFHPTAPGGDLCIYRGESENATYVETYETTLGSEGASAPGAVMIFNVSDAGYGVGSWAVTGE